MGAIFLLRVILIRSILFTIAIWKFQSKNWLELEEQKRNPLKLSTWSWTHQFYQRSKSLGIVLQKRGSSNTFKKLLPSERKEKTENRIIQYLVVTCVCVCLCSSTCWFLPAAQHLWYTWEVRINDRLLWAFSGCFCQVPSSLSPNLSYFTSKDENSSQPLTGEKTIWYNVWNPSKRWYILI